MVAVGLGLAALAAAPRPGRAEPAPADYGVALLPLEADKGLEIYGQPVASEMARALAAGNIRVVVLGPRTAVPDHTGLVIEGTIGVARGGAVTIALRIRRADGGVLPSRRSLAASAPGLAKIDSAAAELSAQLLPVVRELLASLPRESDDHGRVVEVRPVPAPDRPVLVAIGDDRHAADPGPLRGALQAAAADWTRAHHRVPRDTDPARLIAAARTAGADLAIGFSILDWSVEQPDDRAQPAMARARVRVQIVGPRAVVFDRVVATDTVLGDPGRGLPELAARVAREVLAILGPHMRRSVPSWR
ncbi:MAG TPA: hypothetical protein VHT91_43120 [Kofleriaceae bacterium]|jgi:hypothetical protein|nr:hypothetical protein [Kofleriaceae bacterium]